MKAAGVPVSVETDLVWGPVSAALIDESRTAAVVCVGSVGIGASAFLVWPQDQLTDRRRDCSVMVVR